MGVMQESPFTAKASVDLSADQHTFILIDANGEMAKPSAGGRVDGVLLDDPKLGETGTYESAHGQKTKVRAGGSFDVGDDLAAATDGEAVEATSTDVIVAKALQAGSAGAVVTVLFYGHQGVVP